MNNNFANSIFLFVNGKLLGVKMEVTKNMEGARTRAATSEKEMNVGKVETE